MKKWGFAFSFLPLFLPSGAEARSYDIYRADYEKGAFCAVIGGACSSDSDPENSFFQNPAALEAGLSDLVFDGDFNDSGNAEPGMKGGNQVSSIIGMGGIANAGTGWGMGAAFSAREYKVVSKATIFDENDQPRNLQLIDKSLTILFNVPVAFRLTPRLSIGGALLGIYFEDSIDTGNGKSKATRLDDLPRLGLSLGAIYRYNRYLQFGSWIRTPVISYSHVNIDYNSFGNAMTFNEDEALCFPWLWSSGVSINPWNNEKTFFLDAVFVGNTQGAFELTYDTFAGAVSEKGLRKKGQSVVVEPHVGFRSSWYRRSNGSIMAGGYYENSRWDGLPGRMHYTGGIAYKVTPWMEMLAGLDVAHQYFNLFLTFR